MIPTLPDRQQQIAQRAEASLHQQFGALMFRLALAEAEIQQLRAELVAQGQKDA